MRAANNLVESLPQSKSEQKDAKNAKNAKKK
jgi:hypothetical protein